MLMKEFITFFSLHCVLIVYCFCLKFKNLNHVFTNNKKILKETFSKKMATKTYELATKIFGLVAGRLINEKFNFEP